MVLLSSSRRPAFIRVGAAATLAACFFLGLFSGAWFSLCAGDSVLSGMRTAVSGRVSFIGLLASTVLPFLFSAFAVYLKRTVLLVIIAFWKAFFFSYTGFGVFAAWGGAGPLITGLLMFSSLCSMPVLCWYWLRYIGGRNFEPTVCCLILGCLFIISLADYYLIAPFLTNITTF